MKKKLCLAVVLVMLVSMMATTFAGCKKGGDDAVGEDGTYNISMLIHGVPVENEDDYKYRKEVQDAINEKLYKDLGFKVNVNVTSYIDQYETMLALDLANKMSYDIIRATPQLGATYCEQGLFQDLTPLIDKHAPELWDLIPDTAWAENTFDGKIFGIPTASFPISTGLWYRGDWLTKLGKSVPTSMAELEALCQAMLDSKELNKDGKLVPMAGIRDFMELCFLGMFTEHPGDYVEDGKVQPKILDPGYRKYIEKMAEWYKKGYIDDLYVNGDDETINNLMSKNIVGIHVSNVYQLEYTSLNSYNTQMNLDIKWSNPFAADTKKYYSTGCGSDLVVFPTTGKNTEKAFQFYTWYYNNKENSDLVLYGKEGLTYTRAQDAATGKEILSIPESEATGTIATYTDLMGHFGTNVHGSLQLLYTYGSRPTEAAVAYDKCNTEEVMNNYYIDVTKYFQATLPADIATKLADSRDMLVARTTEMVSGKRASTDAEWNSMREEWVKLGGQEVYDYYTKLYNENKDDLAFLQ